MSPSALPSVVSPEKPIAVSVDPFAWWRNVSFAAQAPNSSRTDLFDSPIEVVNKAICLAEHNLEPDLVSLDDFTSGRVSQLPDPYSGFDIYLTKIVKNQLWLVAKHNPSDQPAVADRILAFNRQGTLVTNWETRGIKDAKDFLVTDNFLYIAESTTPRVARHEIRTEQPHLYTPDSFRFGLDVAPGELVSIFLRQTELYCVCRNGLYQLRKDEFTESQDSTETNFSKGTDFRLVSPLSYVQVARFDANEDTLDLLQVGAGEPQFLKYQF